MLTTKEKVKLRSVAQTIKATFQVGKNEISEKTIDEILNYLNKHELIKISVLQNSIYETQEVAEILSNYAEVIQIIGRQIILYMYSDNCKNHVLKK